jgi:hypothetical protein
MSIRKPIAWGPITPLFEVKSYVICFALVAQVASPHGVHWASPMTAFTTNDDPIDAEAVLTWI